MPTCPNCNYELVLLSSRQKYKCALCSKIYPQKEIDNKEFRGWNLLQRELDINNLTLEETKRKSLLHEKKILKAFRLLFKKKRHYRKLTPEERELMIKRRKENIRQKSREWRWKHREYDLKRKQKYHQKNKETINAKAKLRRQNNPKLHNQRNKKWRNNNLEMMRTYGMIQHYRRKQKALALSYLKNDGYKPSSDDIFHSVPTYSLSYLL